MPPQPDKVPEAVQLLAFEDDQEMVNESPWLTDDGVTERLGAEGAGCAATLTVSALWTELAPSPQMTRAW